MPRSAGDARGPSTAALSLPISAAPAGGAPRCLTSFVVPLWLSLFVAAALAAPFAAHAADDPDLIFRKSTVFHWVSPNDKLATYAIDDPVVEGVACHFTVPERGGFKGWVGVAEEVSDISLACRQIGPIKITAKFEQGDDVFRRRRSLLFKKMQIVRGCDVKRNVLVYMVYSDRIIEGSPKNSTSTVPIMPWGGVRGREVRGLRGEVGVTCATMPSACTRWRRSRRNCRRRRSGRWSGLRR